MQLQSRILAILLISQLGADASSSNPVLEVYSSDTWANIKTLPTEPTHPYSVYAEVSMGNPKNAGFHMGIIVITMPTGENDLQNWIQAFEQIKAIWSGHQNRCGHAIYIPHLPVDDSTPLIAAMSVLTESGIKLAFNDSMKFTEHAQHIIEQYTDLFELFNAGSFRQTFVDPGLSKTKSRDGGITDDPKPLMFVTFRDVSGIEYVPELESFFSTPEHFIYHPIDDILMLESAAATGIVQEHAIPAPSSPSKTSGLWV